MIHIPQKSNTSMPAFAFAFEYDTYTACLGKMKVTRESGSVPVGRRMCKRCGVCRYPTRNRAQARFRFLLHCRCELDGSCRAAWLCCRLPSLWDDGLCVCMAAWGSWGGEVLIVVSVSRRGCCLSSWCLGCVLEDSGRAGDVLIDGVLEPNSNLHF
jgi:hypothetical protein